jgi:hypothetical protein
VEKLVVRLEAELVEEAGEEDENYEKTDWCEVAQLDLDDSDGEPLYEDPASTRGPTSHRQVASGLKLPYLGADRDLLEELVASKRLYSLKLFDGFTGCGVLEYLHLAEVTCIGKALIVGILLRLDIRLQNVAGTFNLFTY